MLSNAYFLAKFRFDTAENEPAKNLQNFANPNPHRRGPPRGRGLLGPGQAAAEGPAGGAGGGPPCGCASPLKSTFSPKRFRLGSYDVFRCVCVEI